MWTVKAQKKGRLVFCFSQDSTGEASVPATFSASTLYHCSSIRLQKRVLLIPSSGLQRTHHTCYASALISFLMWFFKEELPTTASSQQLPYGLHFSQCRFVALGVTQSLYCCYRARHSKFSFQRIFSHFRTPVSTTVNYANAQQTSLLTVPNTSVRIT